MLNLGRGAEGRQALGVEKTMVLYVPLGGVENVCGSVPEWAAAMGVEVWALAGWVLAACGLEGVVGGAAVVSGLTFGTCFPGRSGDCSWVWLWRRWTLGWRARSGVGGCPGGGGPR